ncbi:cobalamin biosynthesis protein CobG [Streptomyces armeniacus]|uniref:Cobalamin biosynthesis protein CobG n=1 Tax=Streptomyces armeniacus TaxID=83291 RepID=A0A345XZ30_9ACTN|nr:cobalamin biosynthesis protein CobG [Streptomyces armeniacus]AXK36896.1 cobalamin biosynthesis protein CobG [Streptomyces armeniacus]
MYRRQPPLRETPSRRDRDDACPGTLRLHMADDGALARVRIPGGLLTVRQAHALADAADQQGDGTLHLTSRGNVQLRGLGQNRGHPDACGRELANALSAIGLLPSPRHERVRNIVASPLSGRDGRGRSDVLPWVRQLDRLLCASEAAAALSGRFLFACDDGRGDVAALGADVTVIARSTSDALLRIGPDAHDETVTLPVSAQEAPRAALSAAELFLAAVRDSGTPCWRIRELPGAAALLARAVAERFAADTPRTEPEAEAEAESETEALLPAPHDAHGPTPGEHPAPAPSTRTALCVAAPLGRLTTAQWRLLANTAERDGDDRLHVTPWRSVVLPGLPGLPAPTAGDRLAELAAAGLVTGPDAPLYGVGACAGQPGCAKSRTDVRAHAAHATAATPRTDVGTRGGQPLPVYWSGCERRCGHPQSGDWVDVVATPLGYDITATRGAGPAASAPAGVRLHTAVTDPARLSAAMAAARTTEAPR